MESLSKNRVYVIIVTYNAMKWIDKCLGSLRNSNMPVFPIVVDNLSKDETVKHINQSYPEVLLIINQENKGFGQANNQGIEYAYTNGATHFFLLNQDAWILPDTIEKLITIQTKYHLGIVSPIHLNGKGLDIDINFKRYITNDVKFDGEIIKDMLLNKKQDHYVVPRINAAAWMISRDIIENIGGFDPVFFLYGEDDNYLQRLHYHGYKLAFVPDSFIHHDRLIHGDAKTFKKMELRNWLVGSYTNINICLYAFTKRRFFWHMMTVYLFFKYLFFFKIKSSIGVVGSFIDYLKAWPQIIRSRKVNKQKGANWLSI